MEKMGHDTADSAPSSEMKPIFVVGVGGSGVTPLANLLGNHADFSSMKLHS